MERIIPLVQFTFDEKNPEAGMKGISLVDEPAIESNFQFFDKTKEVRQYFQVAGYEGVVQGLALKPDMPILRYDMNKNPYYGYFTSETIKKLRDSFQKHLQTNNISTDHNGKSVEGYLTESFIIDSESRLADVKSRGIEDATMGSWFVQYKIEDPKVFQRVVDGELRGFSVEAFLQTFLKTNNNPNKIEQKMNKLIEKFQALLDEMKGQKFEIAKIYDGVDSVEWSEIGSPVNIILPDGSKKAAVAGSYITDDQKEIMVDEAGNLVEIKSVTKVIESDGDAEMKKDEKKMEEVEIEIKPEGDMMPPVVDVAPVAEAVDVEAMKAENESLKAMVAELKAELEALKGSSEAMKSNFEKEIATLKKAPLADPVVNPSPEKKKFSKEEVSKFTNLQLAAMKAGIELPKKYAVK